MPHPIVSGKHEEQVSDYEMTRNIIRRAWNNQSIQEKKTTPFRQVYNSGHSQGQKHDYVADNSNYIQYLKQRAIRDNYIR